MYEVILWSRIYSAKDLRPWQIHVPTCCSSNSSCRHYPFVESIFEGAVVQPYIHDCLVYVIKGRHTYHFCIFFKSHFHLLVNQAAHPTNGMAFHGDVLVMRVGQ
ncbi:hypothetical protein K439DRAFT_1370369 [Ramaria rubella]|nr:hypothetical protein K439DRAFT_1370369 [Ramaria rubella]